MNSKKAKPSAQKKPDGSVLPFAPTPSASIAGVTLQQSKHKRRVDKRRLPKDAPNILIVLLDDVGFGLPDTYGGVIRTPTLTRVANAGHQLQPVSYHGDLLAYSCCAFDRAQSSARR